MEGEKNMLLLAALKRLSFFCFLELVLPVDIAKLVDGMNGLNQLSQIELSHGLIELILVSV